MGLQKKLIIGDHVFEGVHTDRFQQVNKSFF